VSIPPHTHNRAMLTYGGRGAGALAYWRRGAIPWCSKAKSWWMARMELGKLGDHVELGIHGDGMRWLMSAARS